RAADIGRLEGQTMRPFPGEDTHGFEQQRPRWQDIACRSAARRCETVPYLLMPGVRGTGLASEVRHEEDVEVREMIGGILRRTRRGVADFGPRAPRTRSWACRSEVRRNAGKLCGCLSPQ